MADFGFKKTGKSGAAKAPGMDLTGIPSGPVALDAEREKVAIKRGEELGFTDRGQGEAARKGGRRKRPGPAPTQTLYIRAPEELADWFQQYTEEKGHRALWQSIEDFRDMVERQRR